VNIGARQQVSTGAGEVFNTSNHNIFSARQKASRDIR
jgi:hypothetical protein